MEVSTTPTTERNPVHQPHLQVMKGQGKFQSFKSRQSMILGEKINNLTRQMFVFRSRSPIEDRRYEKYSHESSGSRSPSPSPSRDMFKSAMYSSGAGLTHMDRSPSPERSLSPIRRTPTSSVTSDKLANGLTHHDSVQQPNAIAAAIQNLLQGGNNASMQQVR